MSSNQIRSRRKPTSSSSSSTLYFKGDGLRSTEPAPDESSRIGLFFYFNFFLSFIQIEEK